MSGPRLSRFVAGPLPAEVERALGRLALAPDVERIAVMPDVHLAEEVCVGVALATRRLLYPAAVGGDIGCGVAALGFDVSAAALEDPRVAARVLEGLYRLVPRERQRGATLPAWPSDLDPEDAPLSAPQLTALAQRHGRAQLGTLGGGNHFIELERDDELLTLRL